MNFEELMKVISQGESETLEFKKSTGQLSEIGKCLCGFLNQKGGMVVIGITDQGKVIGQLISDKTQKDIAQTLNELIPSAPILWENVDIPNSQKKIVILQTKTPIPLAVYHFKGKAYERVGSSLYSMKYERLKQLMLERAFESTWDQLPAVGYKIDDLNEEEILRTVEDGIASGRLERALTSKNDIYSILKGLGLTTDGELTNAAVVLFAKKMICQYSHCEIKMARFKGITKDIGFIDEKIVVGNAFYILREVETFVKRHLNIAIEFSPNSLQRVETPQLPFLAIREALINAICHRDYIYNAGSISLAIYDDRLEIWNIGELPWPLRLDDLKKEHDSILRNKKIAHVFYVRKFVEKWGSGTLRIIALCKELEIPEPQFLQHTGGFCITFKFRNDLQEKRVPKVFVLQDHLADRRARIISILKNAPKGLPIREILKYFNEEISLATLKRELEQLRQIRIVEIQGKGRGTVWKLLNGKKSQKKL